MAEAEAKVREHYGLQTDASVDQKGAGQPEQEVLDLGADK